MSTQPSHVHKKPRGRPPVGYEWDYENGHWRREAPPPPLEPPPPPPPPQPDPQSEVPYPNTRFKFPFLQYGPLKYPSGYWTDFVNRNFPKKS